MSRRAIVECDRCGCLDSDQTQDRTRWSHAFVATLSGIEKVGTAQVPADLCGGCTDDLLAFMNPLPEISDHA
jgi:hypothetical protein